MWKRTASFILDNRMDKVHDSSQVPLMFNQNPDPTPNISAYYQTRTEHHAVVTSDWLAQASNAAASATARATPPAVVGNGGGEFSVIEEFNYWRKMPDLAEAVAAIRALVAVIRTSEATTMMELEIELKKASSALKSWDTTSISLSTSCDLFMRHVTRTSALEYDDFSAAKSRLIERGEKFGEISSKARKTIAMLSQDFIFDGCTILVHGFSRVVLELLKMAASNGKLFKVLCTVGYTIDEVDMVFVGADGVVESGGILNMMGTYQIASVAHCMDKPICVGTES